MTTETVTRFLRDHMLYMDFLVLLFALLAYKRFDKRLNLLFVDVVVGILVVVISKYTSSLGNNVYMSYIYAPYEVLIMCAILFPPAKQKLLRKAVITAAALCLLINFLEGLLIEDGFSQFNSLTYLIINALLGALALHFMIRLRYDQGVENLATQPMFWVALGIAIKHIGLFVVWAFMRFAQNNSMELLWQLALIREVIIYLVLILWIIGFWAARRDKDRT